jgi:hypothetical protein
MKRERKIKFPEPEDLYQVAKYDKKWKDIYTRQVYFLTLLGATDTQLAQVFNVSQTALDSWKEKKPEFLEAIQKGKMIADAKVAHSLYLAAIGYSHEDEVILTNRVKERDAKTGRVVREFTEPLRVKTIKNYPPNVTAAIKWLQSRQPERWGHKVQVDGTINHRHQLDLTKFSTEELRVLSKLGVQGQEIEDADFTENE